MGSPSRAAKWYNNGMGTILSPELQKAVRDKGGGLVEVIDPATNRAYLLVPRELYDRLKPLFEEDPLTREEQRRLLQDAGRRAGWDDADMDAYDRYDETRSQPK